MMLGVSRTHAVPDVPPATRARPPGWRDPRLWVGVAIVAASVLAGARILGAADDAVTVWAAAGDLAPGAEVSREDLVATSVRFDDASDLARYLRAGAALPQERHLLRGLGEGELVPAAALGSAADTGTVSISLAFAAELVPSGIGTGSVVDLWVVPADSAGGRRVEPEPGPVLTDVVVIDAPQAADGLGGVGGGRQLVLAIPESEAAALAQVLAASEDQRIRVLGRG